MAEVRPDFPTLMQQVLAGSEEAAQILTRDYAPLVLRAIRRRLHPRLRTYFDSQDFAQDVWKSFFAAPPVEGRINQPDDLAAYLAAIARNKVVEVTRRRITGTRYNLMRECSMSDPAVVKDEQLPANQPTPSTVAINNEEWERLLDGQPLVYKHILQLLRQGQSAQAIAQQVGVSDRTVRRVIQKAFPRLQS